ncbi:hypothetical protein ACFXPA_47810, partial [Amycolatopsis sp. NPDC059090]|uniref:hypothetical protein n=1 Tax=Amycolatopsis sp. NPDC059090 TaxID=3346723 RepID=UPI00366C727E
MTHATPQGEPTLDVRGRTVQVTREDVCAWLGRCVQLRLAERPLVDPVVPMYCFGAQARQDYADALGRLVFLPNAMVRVGAHAVDLGDVSRGYVSVLSLGPVATGEPGFGSAWPAGPAGDRVRYAYRELMVGTGEAGWLVQRLASGAARMPPVLTPWAADARRRVGWTYFDERDWLSRCGGWEAHDIAREVEVWEPDEAYRPGADAAQTSGGPWRVVARRLLPFDPNAVVLIGVIFTGEDFLVSGRETDASYRLSPYAFGLKIGDDWRKAARAGVAPPRAVLLVADHTAVPDRVLRQVQAGAGLPVRALPRPATLTPRRDAVDARARAGIVLLPATRPAQDRRSLTAPARRADAAPDPDPVTPAIPAQPHPTVPPATEDPAQWSRELAAAVARLPRIPGVQLYPVHLTGDQQHAVLADGRVLSPEQLAAEFHRLADAGVLDRDQDVALVACGGDRDLPDQDTYAHRLHTAMIALGRGRPWRLLSAEANASQYLPGGRLFAADLRRRPDASLALEIGHWTSRNDNTVTRLPHPDLAANFPTTEAVDLEVPRSVRPGDWYEWAIHLRRGDRTLNLWVEAVHGARHRLLGAVFPLGWDDHANFTTAVHGISSSPPRSIGQIPQPYAGPQRYPTNRLLIASWRYEQNRPRVAAGHSDGDTLRALDLNSGQIDPATGQIDPATHEVVALTPDEVKQILFALGVWTNGGRVPTLLYACRSGHDGGLSDQLAALARADGYRGALYAPTDLPSYVTTGHYGGQAIFMFNNGDWVRPNRAGVPRRVRDEREQQRQTGQDQIDIDYDVEDTRPPPTGPTQGVQSAQNVEGGQGLILAGDDGSAAGGEEEVPAIERFPGMDRYVTSDHYSLNHWQTGASISATLHEDGRLTILVERPPRARGHIVGRDLYAAAMRYFRGRVTSIEGHWTYGTNLARFNQLTAL